MNMLDTFRASMLAAGLAVAGPVHAQSTSVPLPPPPAAAQPQPAQAQDSGAYGDGAWNTNYGMIFSVQNVFTQNGILGSYNQGPGLGGGIGLQLTTSPQSAWRFAVDLTRTSNPAYESTATTTVNGVETTGKQLITPPGNSPTSTLDIGVSGVYVMRMTTAAISPYLGAGASLGYHNNARSYTDSTNPAQTINVDNSAPTYAVGLIGQLGLEWRVHRSVSLFAEYGLRVDAFSMSAPKTHMATTNATGTTVVETKGTQTRFFNFDTGLTQAGQLGLVAYF